MIAHIKCRYFVKERKGKEIFHEAMNLPSLSLEVSGREDKVFFSESIDDEKCLAICKVYKMM